MSDDRMMEAAALAASRQRVQNLARWLDGRFRIPGTPFKFGFDSLIGLIPGIGDVAGFVLGSAILFESWRVGAPRALLGRMLTNSAVDGLAGLVPGVGDLLDFAVRSNSKNADLLMRHLDQRLAVEHHAPRQHGAWLLALLLAVPLAILALAFYGLVQVVQALL